MDHVQRIVVVDATAWTYIGMIGMETIKEIVALLTLLATDGATCLRGAPVTTNRGVRGKVNNILLIIDLNFFQDITTPSSLMSPASGDNHKWPHTQATIMNHQPNKIKCEVTFLKTKNLHIYTYVHVYFICFHIEIH